ncbi:unnamed protein product [Urochloa decumbens]|uniref:F-box domain-containing protein n=1 Tax=Urochloa decumbens TaxID=240449 RepID=A0ABC9FQ70_9POAL
MGSSSSRQAKTMRANDGAVLPQDVVYEILLRVPARPLRRFRAVCKSWRSLLSDDPRFAAAHAARHHRGGPLFAVCVATGTNGEVAEIMLLDTSGRAVKRVNAGPSLRLHQILPHHGLVLLGGTIIGAERHPLRVLDPATGAISILPDDNVSHYCYSFVFGRAAAGSTGGDGEYKVLSLSGQTCKILTIDGGNGRWRAAPGPPVSNIDKFPWGTVVVKGVVYLPVYHGEQWKIAGFDLAAEQWQPAFLQGPSTVSSFISGSRFGFLAELNGHLAAVSYYTDSTIEIWMLMDSVELAMWRKKYRFVISCIRRFYGPYPEVKPLSVLDDGRVALWVCVLHNNTGALWIYDPRTKTCIHVVAIENCLKIGVGMYTGNLLQHST